MKREGSLTVSERDTRRKRKRRETPADFILTETCSPVSSQEKELVFVVRWWSSETRDNRRLISFQLLLSRLVQLTDQCCTNVPEVVYAGCSEQTQTCTEGRCLNPRWMTQFVFYTSGLSYFLTLVGSCILCLPLPPVVWSVCCSCFVIVTVKSWINAFWYNWCIVGILLQVGWAQKRVHTKSV